MVIIYKIISPNNKIYIGQTHSLNRRLKEYKNLRCKSQKKLYFSLQKYGWENHKFEVIHELPFDIDQNTINVYEIFYWQQYKDCGFEMLNVREPGSNGKLSLETKEYLSSIRQKEKHFLWRKKHSIETKEKISIAIKELVKGEKNAFYGKKHTEESLNKMRGNKSFSGKTHTIESKSKISLSKLNKKRPILTCPHCNFSGGVGNMQRWHFNNCKNKI
jgi:group I intron endonuclease